jgi:hypothetical protein
LRAGVLQHSGELVMETKAKLGAKAIGRRGMKKVEGYELKEHKPVGA